jgi:hypothetical protein
MACSNSTLNISTWSNAGRPPFDPSARGTARSRSGRNSSKSTRSVSRSSASPLADNSCRRPSTSKNPRCCAIPFTSRPQATANQISAGSATGFWKCQLMRLAWFRPVQCESLPAHMTLWSHREKGRPGSHPAVGMSDRICCPSSAPSRLAQSCVPPPPALSTALPDPPSGRRFRLGFLRFSLRAISVCPIYQSGLR